MNTYDDLYRLFLRRYHPAIAAILAHDYTTHLRHYGPNSLPRQLQREAA